MGLPPRKLAQVLARNGWLRTLERGWDALFCGIGRWRLTHLLGRLRNAWRVPAALRRHRGGKLSPGCGPDRRAGWLDADLGLVGEVHLDAGRRVLQPRGILRLSIPDLAHGVQGYLQPAEETVAARTQAAQASAWKYQGRTPSPGEALNDGFYL